MNILAAIKREETRPFSAECHKSVMTFRVVESIFAPRVRTCGGKRQVHGRACAGWKPTTSP